MTTAKPTVPLTPIVRLYADLHAPGFGRSKRLQRAREYVADPASLAAVFADSVRQMQAFAPKDEPFYRARPQHASGKTASTRTIDVALALQAHGYCTPAASSGPSQQPTSPAPPAQAGATAAAIPLRPEKLAFAYVDRELVPTRVTGGVNRMSGDVAVRLDLLLVNTVDRTPAVCEVKVGGDKDAFAALVQALACVAQLATPAQYARLSAYGAEGRPVSLAETAAPTFDVVVLLHDPPAGTHLPELREATRELAALLLTQPAFAKTVRRIVGLTGTLTEGQLACTCDCAYQRQAR